MADLPSVEQIGRHLTLIALFGCATRDATPEQRARLRDVAGTLREPSATMPLDRIVVNLCNVMGPDWQPVRPDGDPWSDWLLALLEEAQGR